MVDTTLDPRENGFKPALLLTVMSYLTPAIFKHVSGYPRMRGEQQRYLVPCPAVPGITPACAGSRAVQQPWAAVKGDHPRMRGEQWPTKVETNRSSGSPPHARGAVNAGLTAQWEAGITPACAGSSDHRHRWRSADRDHPRMRGEQQNRNCF